MGEHDAFAARSQPSDDHLPDIALPHNELPFHHSKALENGVSREEIIETITPLAFYAGWPPAMTALAIARNVFEPAKE